MAIYYSPRIVSSGMSVYLDAGNPKSYRGSGTSWRDLSGNGNNAITVNSPSYSSDNSGSIVFDGINQYVDVTSSANILSTTAYTKMAFVYPTSYATSNNIISGGNSGQHAFWMAAGNKFQAGHNGNWYTIASNSIVPLNRWTFGAVTFSSTTGWEIYYNGRRETTNASTSTFTGTGNIFVGSYTSGANVFSGRISCVIVYNRVLTQDEILQNYDALSGRFGL